MSLSVRDFLDAPDPVQAALNEAKDGSRIYFPPIFPTRRQAAAG